MYIIWSRSQAFLPSWVGLKTDRFIIFLQVTSHSLLVLASSRQVSLNWSLWGGMDSCSSGGTYLQQACPVIGKVCLIWKESLKLASNLGLQPLLTFFLLLFTLCWTVGSWSPSETRLEELLLSATQHQYYNDMLCSRCAELSRGILCKSLCPLLL